MQHRTDDNAQQPLASVLDTMQQTPLVRLDRLTRAYGVSGTILAKLDSKRPEKGAEIKQQKIRKIADKEVAEKHSL